MSALIKDKFAKLRVSKQIRYQLRNKAAGKCIICGAKAINGVRCELHRSQLNRRQRKGTPPRYPNERGYKPRKMTLNPQPSTKNQTQWPTN